MSSSCNVPLYNKKVCVDLATPDATLTTPVTVSENCILNITLNILTDFSFVQN